MFGKIYMLRNKINGKVYIGQTTRDDRFKSHISIAKSMKRTGKKLNKFYNAIIKYGADNFEEIILQSDIVLYSDTKTKTTSIANLEKKYIKKYNSFKNGYNSTEGGDGMLGYKHTDLTKYTMSQIQKKLPKHPNSIQAIKNSSGFSGHKHTDETKKLLSEKNSGYKHTDEAKSKISKTHKGRKLSDEHKLKLSIGKRGLKNPNYRKKASDETRQKMSEARLKKEYFNILKDGNIIQHNVIWNDIKNTHQGLKNTTEFKPLGSTPQAKGLLKKVNKLHMIGWYIEPIVK